jgi:hypothetical protein
MRHLRHSRGSSSGAAPIARGVGAAGAFLAIVLLLAPSLAYSVGSVSTVAPRPLAMGGAFMAVDDELTAIAWNPGGFVPPACRRGGNFRVHANVLGAPAIVRETGLLTGVFSEEFDRLPGAEQAMVALGSLIKGVSFRRGGFTVGALLLEEHLDPAALAESKGLADASDLLAGYYSSVGVAFTLDPRVSIGTAVTLFAGFDDDGERWFGSGRSYGAVLRPNDVTAVGFTYFDADETSGDYRLGIEGLAPQTMNAGLAYRPLPRMLLTFDLRDLAEKHEATALTPRAGVEWDLWGRVALRAGAFVEDGGDSRVLTVGLGAIPMVACRGGETSLPGGAYVLNYAALLSDGRGPSHLLSAVLHF